MIDKRYYEKLGGFAYLLGELRKKLGREQTDILVNDAVTLCKGTDFELPFLLAYLFAHYLQYLQVIFR